MSFGKCRRDLLKVLIAGMQKYITSLLYQTQETSFHIIITHCSSSVCAANTHRCQHQWADSPPKAPPRRANVSCYLMRENLPRASERKDALNIANLHPSSQNLARFSCIRQRETFRVNIAPESLLDLGDMTSKHNAKYEWAKIRSWRDRRRLPQAQGSQRVKEAQHDFAILQFHKPFDHPVLWWISRVHPSTPSLFCTALCKARYKRELLWV